MGLRSPLPLSNVQKDREQVDSIEARATLSEADTAFVELAQMDTAVEAIARTVAINELEERSDDLVDPNELNQIYPDLTTPFTKPVNRLVADEIAERQRRRRRLEQTIARGPQGTFYDIERFGASLVVHAADPIELASGFVASGALALTAAKAAKQGRMAWLTTRAPTAGQEFARTATEGVLGNLAVEPFILSANQQDNTDYQIADSFTSVAGGAVGFAGVRYGLNRAGAYVKRLGNKQQDIVQRSAVGQLVQDKTVRVDPVIKDLVNEVSVKPSDHPSNSRVFEYVPLRPEQVPGKKMFMASKKSQGDIRRIGSEIIEDDLGEGIYVTDNVDVANGYAARKSNPSLGSVTELEMGDARLIDLEREIPPDSRAAFQDLLDGEVSNKTGKELVEDIRNRIIEGKLDEDAFNRLNRSLKAKGFDGYRHQGGNFLGQQNSAHNILMLFDSDKVSELSRLSPDKSQVAQPPKGEVAEFARERQSRESELLFDETEFREFQSIVDEPPKSPGLKQIIEQENELVETLESLDSQGLLTKSEKNKLKAIKSAQSFGQRHEQLIKAITFCLGRKA